MTRSAIGAIAAGAFVLGILAGVLVPGALARWEHGDWMNGPMSGMHAGTGMPMMGGSTFMMGGGSMMGVPGMYGMSGFDHPGYHGPQGMMR